MAPSSTSYLQTLPKSEATAFVASLQKVKEHLNQELQWMNEQVQQKTTQLDGIETLLSEAAALGLLSAEAASTKVSKPKTPAPETNGTAEAAALLANLPSISTKDEAPADQAAEGTSTGVASAVAPTPTRKTSSTQKKAKSSKIQKKKPTAAKSATAAKGKPAKTTTAKPAAPVENGSKSPASGNQPLFKSQFRDVPVIDAVGEILKRAKASVSADDVIDQLYDEVPDKDYKRVKHSISNVLSLGKSKKRWKSTGRGMYAI